MQEILEAYYNMGRIHNISLIGTTAYTGFVLTYDTGFQFQLIKWFSYDYLGHGCMIQISNPSLSK